MRERRLLALTSARRLLFDVSCLPVAQARAMLRAAVFAAGLATAAGRFQATCVRSCAELQACWLVASMPRLLSDAFPHLRLSCAQKTLLPSLSYKPEVRCRSVFTVAPRL